MVASLLFTPYVGFQDFAVLIVAGWLLIRSGATVVQGVLMVVGYAVLELALVVLAVPILIAEAALLVSLAWPAAQAPGDLRRVRSVVSGHVANDAGDRDLADRAQRA